LAQAPAPVPAQTQIQKQDADYQKYQDGQAALDHLQWQKAVSSFQGMSEASAQAEGALYWKAFALYKAGQGRGALAPIAELRKTYPQSGWLPDAETLAAAIAQNAGAAAGKDAVADVRQNAVADQVRADSAHAAQILRAAVFGMDLPGVRQKALYSLSRESSPESHKIVLEVARGAANPDLQFYAISRLGKSDPQAVFDLYKAVDSNVKSFILSVLSSDRESVRLMKIAAGETSDDLRLQALSSLVEVGTEAQVRQSLQSENAADVKTMIETRLGNLHKWVTEQLLALQTAKDPRERRMGAVGLTRGGDESTERALVAAYSSEKDAEVKGAIVFALSERKDYAALQTMAKSETDPGLKARLSMALDNAGPK
jgi:hypothetical protein